MHALLQRSAVIPSAEQQRATFVTGSNNTPMTHSGSDIVSVISSGMNNYNDEESRSQLLLQNSFVVYCVCDFVDFIRF